MPSVQISEKSHELLNNKKKYILEKYGLKVELSTMADKFIQVYIDEIEERLGLKVQIKEEK